MRFSVLRVQSYRFSGQRGPDEAGGWNAIKQGTSSGHQARRRDDQGNFPGMECVTSQKKGPERLVQGQKKPLNQGALAWSQHSENFSRPSGQTQGFQIRL